MLAVDDEPVNLRLIDAVLSPQGERVLTARSGEEALELLRTADVDLVLLDLVLPGLDGYEVCRRIRSDPATAFLPVVMITASGQQQKLPALQAGADDFVTKPFNQTELITRVRSLARVKRYHDTIARQAAELAAWNAELEQRVQAQVDELERISRLRRFLAPQVADLVVDSGGAVLDSHRRDVVVVFCDLRGFTSFAEATEPEEVMEVLASYHAVLGELVFAFEGTLERFTGDGVMIFFNDPVPCEDPGGRALRMALEIRARVRALSERWSRRGHDLALGIGVASGYATLGRIGFEGRSDYAAIGSVTNLSARLCSVAGPWQVLVAPRVLADLGYDVVGEPVGPLTLRGFSRPVAATAVEDLEDGRGAELRDAQT
ncbi:Adenylate and Guanylate cyclase catalytic domain-containing protein [Friedmanniella luteola]|uniref:Adenylate and Guanylate cyclase catalytic domain-containing protein n=1 Tax=Friedmanniella luteola TaxID=546871 RepID=A0A1H1XIP2_9ACTN|nr:Adenylate and Guanylate cyclase catalytic domain-containing protein [Friedmanniella luteola]